MSINTAPLRIGSRAKSTALTTPDRAKWQEKPKVSLRELEQKQYPFPDSDVPDMLEQLLEKKLIELPEPKRPNEKDKVNDPKFCKYHRIISHPTEKCFILKELIMRLKEENKIILDTSEVATANQATISTEPSEVVRPNTKEVIKSIQFGTMEPVNLSLLCDKRDTIKERRPTTNRGRRSSLAH